MDTGLLRTIWSVIEEMPAYYLQQVSSSEQVRLLLQRVENRVMLSSLERAETRQYLCDRKTLIREMSLEQVM
ncbi:MAG: hypothetical protein AAFY72_16435 [Cyanobacteria bacterium J06649_4]